jgi:hypothetical protein
MRPGLTPSTKTFCPMMKESVSSVRTWAALGRRLTPASERRRRWSSMMRLSTALDGRRFVSVCSSRSDLRKGGGEVIDKGVGPSTTLAWTGWKQPDIPVEVDTARLEISLTEAGVLKKFSLAGIAKLSRLKYS